MAIDDSLERARLHPDVLKNLSKNKKLRVAEPYSEDNPPPYPVTSVNGQTGDVGIPTVDRPVSVQDGGTGATTAAQAAKNLGVLPLGEVVTKIPSGADLNDYDLPGVYAIGSSSTAATIANMPSQSAGTLRVFSSAGNAITASSIWKYLIQEYIVFTGARYQRYGESGSSASVTWGAWKTYYNSSDFPFQIDNSDKALRITSDWFIRRGTDGYIPTLRTGYINSGSSLDIATSPAFIVLSYSGNHCAIYNCLGSSVTRLAGTATSSVETSGGGYRVTNTGSGTLRYFILTLL